MSSAGVPALSTISTDAAQKAQRGVGSSPWPQRLCEVPASRLGGRSWERERAAERRCLAKVAMEPAFFSGASEQRTDSRRRATRPTLRQAAQPPLDGLIGKVRRATTLKLPPM